MKDASSSPPYFFASFHRFVDGNADRDILHKEHLVNRQPHDGKSHPGDPLLVPIAGMSGYAGVDVLQARLRSLRQRKGKGVLLHIPGLSRVVQDFPDGILAEQLFKNQDKSQLPRFTSLIVFQAFPKMAAC